MAKGRKGRVERTSVPIIAILPDVEGTGNVRYLLEGIAAAAVSREVLSRLRSCRTSLMAPWLTVRRLLGAEDVDEGHTWTWTRGCSRSGWWHGLLWASTSTGLLWWHGQRYRDPSSHAHLIPPPPRVPLASLLRATEGRTLATGTRSSLRVSSLIAASARCRAKPGRCRWRRSSLLSMLEPRGAEQRLDDGAAPGWV